MMKTFFRRFKIIFGIMMFLVLIILVAKGVLQTFIYTYLFPDDISEEAIDLGSNYTYLKPYGLAFDNYAYGGDGVFKANEGMTGMGMPVILSSVKGIEYDSLFIVASQTFNKKETHNLLGTFLHFDSVTYRNKTLKWSCKLKNPFYDPSLYKPYQKKYNGNSLKMEPFIDSTITNNVYFKQVKRNKYNYWIIDKKKDYIYGPLTKARYQELKDSLHIHLELKDTYENIISRF